MCSPNQLDKRLWNLVLEKSLAGEVGLDQTAEARLSQSVSVLGWLSPRDNVSRDSPPYRPYRQLV